MYLRRSPDWKDNLGAGLVAAGAAAVVFYFARLLIAREPLGTTRGAPGEPEPDALPGSRRRLPRNAPSGGSGDDAR